MRSSLLPQSLTAIFISLRTSSLNSESNSFLVLNDLLRELLNFDFMLDICCYFWKNSIEVAPIGQKPLDWAEIMMLKFV